MEPKEQIKAQTEPRKDAFLETFTLIAKRREEPREYKEIAKEMQNLWKLNALQCVKLTTYTRIVETDADASSESILRLYWIATKQKPTFTANIAYFIAAGSWRDLVTLMNIDLSQNGWNNRKLDWNLLYSALCAGLVNEDTVDEVKKYLPAIKSSKDATTNEAKVNCEIGKWISIRLYGKPEHEGDFSSYKHYRKLKSNGTAEEWQKVIIKAKALNLDFAKIYGKSLSLLVGEKYLKENGLFDIFKQWIASNNPANAKSDVYSVFKPFGSRNIAEILPDYQKLSIDADFESIINKAKRTANTSTLVVRDISSSTEGIIPNVGMSTYFYAKAIALFYSTLNTSYFHNKYMIFTKDSCALREWQEGTPSEQWVKDEELLYSENNSLEKIANYFGTIKISEGEMPRQIIVISDRAFKDKSLEDEYTKFKAAMINNGYSETYINSIRVVIVDLPNNKEENNTENTYKILNEKCAYVCGYDSYIMSTFIGTSLRRTVPKTARDFYNEAMNHDLLKRLSTIKLQKIVEFAKKGSKEGQK